MVLVFHDATEKRRAGEVLREAACRKEGFLALIGHELRNPLGPIRNAMHILGKTPQRDPTVERLRQVVTRQVTHMTRMVDDLLDVSRISRGPIPLQLELLDLVARFVIKVPLVQALRPIEHPVGGSPLTPSCATSSE